MRDTLPCLFYFIRTNVNISFLCGFGFLLNEFEASGGWREKRFFFIKKYVSGCANNGTPQKMCRFGRTNKYQRQLEWNHKYCSSDGEKGEERQPSANNHLSQPSDLYRRQFLCFCSGEVYCREATSCQSSERLEKFGGKTLRRDKWLL